MTAANVRVPASGSIDHAPHMMPKSGVVLITGGRGQLAVELVRTVPERWTAWTQRSDQLDITDESRVLDVLRSERPDVVINAAAYNDVDGAETHTKRAYAVNTDGPAHLARACAETGARLVHISTDFVFAGDRNSPYMPTDVAAPLSTYGVSKLRGEENVRSILGDGAVTIRTSWLYSAHGSNVVTRMLALLRGTAPLRVVSDQVSAPTWTRSLAAAIWRVLELPQVHGIHHWRDAGSASRYELAVAIQEDARALGLLESPRRIDAVHLADFPAAARRPSYSVLDTHETTRALGMEAPDWRSNLHAMLSNAVSSGEIV
jgi:dTDP-4-dehydrorhamnose reductase